MNQTIKKINIEKAPLQEAMGHIQKGLFLIETATYGQLQGALVLLAEQFVGTTTEADDQTQAALIMKLVGDALISKLGDVGFPIQEISESEHFNA